MRTNNTCNRGVKQQLYRGGRRRLLYVFTYWAQIGSMCQIASVTCTGTVFRMCQPCCSSIPRQTTLYCPIPCTWACQAMCKCCSIFWTLGKEPLCGDSSWKLTLDNVGQCAKSKHKFIFTDAHFCAWCGCCWSSCRWTVHPLVHVGLFLSLVCNVVVPNTTNHCLRANLMSMCRGLS